MRLLAGPETLVAQQLNAVEKQAQPFVQSSDQFQSGLGMQQDPAFTEALSRRGQKIFDRDYTDLRRQLQLEAPSYQQQRMAAVMPAMAAKAQENHLILRLRSLKTKLPDKQLEML